MRFVPNRAKTFSFPKLISLPDLNNFADIYGNLAQRLGDIAGRYDVMVYCVAVVQDVGDIHLGVYYSLLEQLLEEASGSGRVSYRSHHDVKPDIIVVHLLPAG